LNRSYRGVHGLKDTTYVVDFVNDPQEVLQAFQTYYATATLADVTDPHLVFDLRAKLDAAGHYEFEVERVVTVAMKQNAKQSELTSALEPVVSRLLHRYKAAQARLKVAQAANDGTATEAARGELNALALFKGDMGAFQRMYAFLSQIFGHREAFHLLQAAAAAAGIRPRA